jgi:hypothetical protein
MPKGNSLPRRRKPDEPGALPVQSQAKIETVRNTRYFSFSKWKHSKRRYFRYGVPSDLSKSDQADLVPASCFIEAGFTSMKDNSLRRGMLETLRKIGKRLARFPATIRSSIFRPNFFRDWQEETRRIQVSSCSGLKQVRNPPLDFSRNRIEPDP